MDLTYRLEVRNRGGGAIFVQAYWSFCVLLLECGNNWNEVNEV